MIEDLRQLFEDVLRQPMPTLNNQMRFDELPGWDSVAHLSLLLAVERHFNIAFTSVQMIQMKTIGELMAVLENANG